MSLKPSNHIRVPHGLPGWSHCHLRPVVYFTWVCNPVVLSVYTFFTAIITPLLLVMPFATFFHDKRMLRTWIFIIAAGMPGTIVVRLS